MEEKEDEAMEKEFAGIGSAEFCGNFANVTPKYHTVSAASKTTLNYKRKH